MPFSGKLYRYAVLLCLFLVQVGCSVEKNTGATRFYHGLTARYNIYFNGYESYKAGVIKVNNGYIDDYAEILRVFEFSDPKSPSLCMSDMEKAILKASNLISLKSITAKPENNNNDRNAERDKALVERKEYNEWVDDSYLLIGKARFYKHEFNDAAAVFDYCIVQANDPDIKTEASLWLARLYNETGKYPEAFRILSETEITSESTRSLRSMYYSTLADHFIKQKKYPDAVDPLANAVKLVSGKRSRYRLTYLLAQLNENAGNSARAISLYRDVTKMNPPYDVEFNARINIAGVFDINSGNSQDLRRELDRMLKDSKNKDFLDQIYYALGNLSMKEGNEKEALDYFARSASAPSLNPNQKGRSYLALAEYYYKKPDFLKAGKYYDSSVFFLEEKHQNYQFLKSRSQDLNSVVSQLVIIEREDSLQRVASMSEGERSALISSIINDIIKAESEGKTSQYSDRYNLGQYYENERRFQGNIEQEGKWYFYNQAALTFGRTEFKRRWGDRRLEDNWRRVNRARVTVSQATAEGDEPAVTGTDTAGAVMDYKKPEFYLKNLPLTDSMLAKSNILIVNALLNAGKAYAEKLSDTGKATESLESLLQRFPSDELVPEALYHLYRINIEPNPAKSETYRQRLLQKYPDTEFSLILSDPQYYAKKQADLKKAEQMYESAYDKYLNEDFATAILICEEAINKYSNNILIPKFMLLHAFCTARISDEKAFRDELAIVIKTWPESEEGKKASGLIAFLDQEMPELKVEEEKEIALELFVADTTKPHIFALVINNPAFNINQATFDVISYNIDNFTNDNYRTQGELIDNKYIIITVSGFSGYKKSVEYFKSFSTDKLVRNIQGSPMFTFIISPDNLNVLSKDRNPERYRLFFMDNYKTE